MIRAVGILLGFLTAGECIVFFTGLKLPGSIIGMGLLFAALQAGWGNVLMTNLSLFLVPACVAVISYLDLIRKDWLSITVATLASTFLVLFVTGKAHELMRRYW